MWTLASDSIGLEIDFWFHVFCCRHYQSSVLGLFDVQKRCDRLMILLTVFITEVVPCIRKS